MLKKEIFDNARILFKIQGCEFCLVYDEFIRKINMKLSLDKQIQIVDCTLFKNFGIISNSLILLFYKHIEGYPTLFFDGRKLDGTPHRLLLETFINYLVHKEYKVKEENPLEQEKQCKLIEKGKLKGGIVCE